jgi:ADP-heptose:LPS heptosyltransferase
MIDAYCAIAGVEPARPQMGASVQHYAGPSIVYAPSSRERMRSLPDDIRAEIEKGLSDLGDVTTIGRGATMCGSIRDLLNLIASASVVVTVDTGALHIAGALGIPVVLISAAKPHDILMPHYIGVTVEPDAECAGCRLDHTSSTYSRQCLFGCAALEHVDAAAVISAAEASLSAQR